MSVSYWTDVTLTVEAAFSAATGTYGVWNTSVWDTGTWGPDVVWSDITQYVRSFQTVIGRTREYDHFSAGTATIVLDNRDARFSPENTSGPYTTGGVTGVRPWRPIRIKAAYAGTTYPVWYGFTESFVDSFPGTRDSITTITAVDGIAVIAAFNGYAQSPVGDGEAAGLRMQRILDNASWTLPRTIDVSGTLVQATTLADNAWTEILLTADSDGGEVWVDTDGTFIFENAGAPYEQTRENTSQATFSDTNSSYIGIEFAYDGDLLVNFAKLAATGGVQQTAADNTSRSLYGDHLFSRSDLICDTDSQVLSLANRLVTLRSQPEERVKSITLVPRGMASVLWPQALGRRIKDRITVQRTVPGTAVMLNRDCFIDGIEHDVTPENWVTTFRTASASAYATSTQLATWDSGRWDQKAFGF